MAKTVTQEHFDATMTNFRAEMHNTFVTKDEFRRELASFRDEMNARFDDVMTKMDAIMTMLMRLDQERIVTNERLRRLEANR